MPGNIINLTLADIAKWPTPNYVDPPRRHWMPPYAATWLAMATLLVAIRLWIRARKHAGGLGIDDALLVCAWLALAAFTALCIVGSENFMTSRHMWDIPVSMYEHTALLTWVAELIFLVCSCFIKVSVLLFYRRLVDRSVSKYWVWTVVGAIVFTISYSLAFTFLLVFNCSPTRAYWKAFNPSWTGEYHCVDTSSVNLLAGIMAIISDLYSVILPCLMTRHLRLPTAQKLGLHFIFSLGLCAVTASAVRTYWLYQVGHSSDVSTCIFYVFVWAQLELSLGIVCTALPSLRVVFRQYLSSSIARLGTSLSPESRHRQSDEVRIIQGQFIAGISSADIHKQQQQQQVQYSAKHTPTSSTSTCRTSIVEVDEVDNVEEQRDSWARGIPYLVRTPEEYESYNLQNMEKYRKSTHARVWSKSTRNQSVEKFEVNITGKSWLVDGE